MRGLIVGLGSIGKRHLDNLRRLVPNAEITVWRREGVGKTDPGSADRVVFTLEEAVDPVPDFAILSSPSPMHTAVATSLAQRGVHLLVEKPLSDRLAGVDELIETCRQRHLTLLVGYTLRFHPGLLAVKDALDRGRIGNVLGIHASVGQYLPDWRPGIDYRKSVTGQKELGGGALLELSHEIDYVRWLAGEVASVTAITDRLSDLEVDVEDWAEITLRFASNSIGHLHLDMVQRKPARYGRAIGSEGTLHWDLLANRVRLQTPHNDEDEELLEERQFDRNQIYIELLKHFFDCIARGTPPICTGTDGRRVLEIALAARTSSASGQRIAL